MLTDAISLFLPERAAINQTLGHPAAGVINWLSPQDNPSGEPVTADIALNYSAVWCATRVLSETVAGLPCYLYRKTAGDGKEKATDDPRFMLTTSMPNDWQTSYTFFDTGTNHLVNWGNAYARLERRSNEMVSAMTLAYPGEVELEMPDEVGELVYGFINPTERLTAYNVLHPIGVSSYLGYMGDSVIQRAKLTIGGAIAAEKHAAGFYKNAAVPSGVLTHPERLNKEARENFRRDWEREHDGQSKLAILHGGMTYQVIGMSHSDAQFLESRQFSVSDIA